MKKRVLHLVMIVTLLVLAVSSASLAGASPLPGQGGPAQDNASGGAALNNTAASAPAAPTDVLWNNGPLVNSPGTGPGGADESIARDVTSGLSSRGFNVSLLSSARVADDFYVSHPGGWTVDDITFFVYMGNSPTSPSPITGINYQIWDGPPDDPLSMVVYGDTTTNRLTSTTWANMYRRLESTPTDASRPVMSNVAAGGFNLAPGHYWLDWEADGDQSFTGPWQPPITMNNVITTGNALQFFGGAWQPLVDAGTGAPQDAPFLIQGSGGQAPTCVRYNVVLGGSQETPPNASTATGSAIVEVHTDTNMLDYNIVFSGLSAAETAAHIHGFAPRGVSAGVLVPLPAGSPKVGSWTYLDAQEAGILSGQTYINIHTSNYPGGEIRGQIDGNTSACGSPTAVELSDLAGSTPANGWLPGAALLALAGAGLLLMRRRTMRG